MSFMAAERMWGQAPLDWIEAGIPANLSRDDVIVFLGRGTPRRTRTLKSHVRRIPPGHKLNSGEHERWLVRTWSAVQARSPLAADKDEIVSELRSLLFGVVKELGIGKKVGVLLSGGFDSTLVLVLLLKAGIIPQCYTIEPVGPEPSEWEYARATADFLGVPIRRVTVTLDDLLQTSKEIYQIRPLPQVSWITGSQFAASRAAKEDGCDVLMLGLGSDELFGPYPRAGRTAWKFERLAESQGTKFAWEQVLGEQSTARTEMLFLGNVAPFQVEHLTSLFPDVDATVLLQTDIVDLFRELHASSPDSEISNLFLQMELELRSADVLIDELNAASALAGMQIAYPFYEKSVVELAAGIPLSLKCVRTEIDGSFDPDTFSWKKVIDKYILRIAFEDALPECVTNRPRYPYTVPFSAWMRAERKQVLLDTILRSPLWEEIGASRKSVEAIACEDLDQGNPWRAPLRFWLFYQLVCWREYCL
jgi:asparagine synthase (glutamine-hydrolysing)